MANKEVVQLEVQLDTRGFSKKIAEVKNLFEGLETTAGEVGNAVSDALNPDASGLQAILTNIGDMATDLDAVATRMQEVVDLMDPQKESWFDSIVGGVDAFNTLADGREKLEGLGEAINEGIKGAEKHKEAFNLFKAFFPETIDATGDITQRIQTMFSQIDWESIKGIIPNFWTTITSKFSGDGVALGGSVSAMLQPVVDIFGKIGGAISGMSGGWLLVIGAVIAGIILLIQNWDTVVAVAQQVWSAIQTKLAEFSDFLEYVFTMDYTEHFGALGSVLNAFFANVKNVWDAIKKIFSGIVTFISGIFAGDWKKAWDGIVELFSGIWDGLVAVIKWPINGIIGLINGMVQGIVDGVNLVIGVLNGMSFDIPDWVPVIGGETFGFNLVPLKAPQIPYLAKGAVLPANKPFLAVVGDQKHGTNVEAPLATIQEAVALVMEDQFAGMMAGFEASVGVQKQILQAILGIEIGDTTIGQAAARYNHKMAIIKGGM